MCLRFVFLLVTRLAAWPRLSRREGAWKTAEILILRHQLAVLQRRAATPPERELGGPGTVRNPARVIPRAQRQRLRLLVTLWGARSLLAPVTCVDRRPMAIGNDDHLCLSACST